MNFFLEFSRLILKGHAHDFQLTATRVTRTNSVSLICKAVTKVSPSVIMILVYSICNEPSTAHKHLPDSDKTDNIEFLH